MDLRVVCGLDTSFDPQHFSNRVLVSMADLKFFPGLPEICSHLKDPSLHIYITVIYDIHTTNGNLIIIYSVVVSHPWVANLRAVGVDCSGPVDLTKLTLHVSKSLTHIPCVLIRKYLGRKKWYDSDYNSIFESELVKGFF